MPERPFSEKMTAFTGCISQMIAGGGPSDAGAAIFAGSADLIRDPEIREIREAAGKRMTGLLLRLVAEGKQQGQVDPTLSDGPRLPLIFGRSWTSLSTPSFTASSQAVEVSSTRSRP